MCWGGGYEGGGAGFEEVSGGLDFAKFDVVCGNQNGPDSAYSNNISDN